jgi:hypothetical protein
MSEQNGVMALKIDANIAKSPSWVEPLLGLSVGTLGGAVQGALSGNAMAESLV